MLALSSCAAAPALMSVADFALEKSGLKKPDVPEMQKPPRMIAIKLHAGVNLNSDANGHPLAVVTRIYKLRDLNAFNQAPYDVFLDPQKEKQTLGADIVEVREITLIPGQRYEATEKVAREAGYVGVVALFRAPAAARWRYVFGSEQAERSGVTLGVLSCAMTVAAGDPLGVDGPAQQRLAPVRCA